MTIGRCLCVRFLLLFFVDVAFPSLRFDTINSTILLNDTAASLQVTTPELLGWVDASVKRKIRGFGDYDLLGYDTDDNTILSYTEVPPSEFVFYDYSVAANTVQHVTQDTVFDLGGKYFKFEDYAQLFVDTNVTVTIRNATIRYEATLPTFPPIRLVSPGSKIAFDNVTMLLSDDFHFLQGQLFVHNNFTMVGNHAFVYNSPNSSFIASGATWKFDAGTTFSVAPATFTDAPYTLKNTYTDCNFIKMAASSSQLSLNGCSLMTTYTGLRLTKGNVLCDNAVSCVSDATVTITGYFKMNTGYGSGSTFDVYSMAWSSDGRTLVVGGGWSNDNNYVKAYSFDGSSLTPLAAVGYPWPPNFLSWHPDGKLLVVVGGAPEPRTRAYSFDGASFTEAAAPPYLNVGNGLSWSPDGRYLAISGDWPNNYVRVYRYINNSFVALASQPDYGDRAWAVSWHPSGRFLTVGGMWANNFVKVYAFDGSTFTSLQNPGYPNNGRSVSWSSDGRFLACAGFTPTDTNNLIVYRFDGTSFVALPVPDDLIFQSPYRVVWSPDGKFIALSGISLQNVKIYRFNGTNLELWQTPNYAGTHCLTLDWNPDGRHLAAGGAWTGINAVVYPFALGSETTSQAASSSIIFGDSAKGSAFDVSVQFANNAVVRPTHGKLVYDCVN